MAGETRHSRVVDAVASEIVARKLVAGDVLSLASLQEDYGISRTVAREVMRMLESVGMVSSQRSVGLVVLPESQWDALNPRVIEWRLAGDGRPAQLRSLTELRAAVEPMAAAAAARNARPEEREKLIETAHRLKKFGDEGNLDRFNETDIEFHGLLLSASGNELFASLKDIFAVTLTGRVRHGLMPGNPRPEAIAAHLAVAVAVSASDPTAAFNIMMDMLSNLRTDLFPEQTLP